MPIPFYREQALETIAWKILCQYDPYYLNGKPHAVPIETIIEDTFGLIIEYQYLKQFKDELGKMVYDNGYVICFDREKDDYTLLRVKMGTMLIESSLAEDPAQYGRLRFTLAHELSHWILHQRLFEGTNIAAAMYDENDDSDATEWQANYLAQALLMPNGQVKHCFYSIQASCETRKEKIEAMANVFEVSKQAMEIRLKKFKLIT